MQALFKYDFRATARYMLPLYLLNGVISVSAVLLWCFDIIQQDLVLNIFDFLFLISLVITIVLPFLILLMVYYERMHGNYATLIHSFPLTARQKLHSQIWNYFVWSVLTTLVFIIQLSVLIWVHGAVTLDQINTAIGYLLNYLNLSYWGLSALVAFSLIICIAFIFMGAIQYFALVTLSVHFFTTRHVLLGFIFLYILFTTLVSATSYGFFLVFPYYISFDFSASHLAISWITSGDSFNYFGVMSSQSLLNMPWVNIIEGVLSTAILYGLTRYLLAKKISVK